ncbi:MAG: glycosyltransferase family 2 protein [Bdellovibrionota bacterium]
MKISVVTTLYRSASFIPEFHRRTALAIQGALPSAELEFVFVDDGSPDESVQVARGLLKEKHSVRIVALSRNYGHHRAIMTGLEHAQGELVFLIDCDLEEPPEMFPKLLETMQAAPKENAIDVVYAVQRKRRGGFFERVSGALFYRLFNFFVSAKVHPNWMIARLMTRRYVRGLVAHSERELFLGGLLSITGFRQEGVAFDKGSKGSTAYTLSKKLWSTLLAFTSFSDKPLFVIFFTGLGISAATFGVILFLLFRILVLGFVYQPGWTSLLLATSFFGGLTMTSIGVLGLYLGRVFMEVKHRPCVIKEVLSN